MAIDTITISDANGVDRKVVVDNDGSNNLTQVEKLGFSAEDAAPVLVSATNPLPVAASEAGTYGYAAGTSTATVDVPSSARVKRVSVLASSGGSATITIAGGNTITVPASGSFDEQIPGLATAGGDVVIGGSVASYYVSWTV